ncbi:MAG: hypothetical protein ABFS45_03890 [Pseudomonadota bacterium]
MAKKKKKTSITVDSDDFEEQIRDFFNRTAVGLDIPRGEFLSRAMYLACLEYYGEITMKVRVDTMRKYAQEKGLTFKDEVVLDTREWEKHIRDLQNKRYTLENV